MSSIFGLQSSYMLEYCWLFALFLRSARCFAGARVSGLCSHLSRCHLLGSPPSFFKLGCKFYFLSFLTLLVFPTVIISPSSTLSKSFFFQLVISYSFFLSYNSLNIFTLLLVFAYLLFIVWLWGQLLLRWWVFVSWFVLFFSGSTCIREYKTWWVVGLSDR